MICPRCEIASLEERLRAGVRIHVCCGCSGVWLGRGELKNLVVLLSSQWEASRQDRAETSQSRPNNWFEPIGDIMQ